MLEATLWFHEAESDLFHWLSCFTDVPQLLKVHSLMFKSPSDHIQRLRSALTPLL